MSITTSGGLNDGWSEEYEAGRRDALAGRDADVRGRVAGMFPIDYQAGFEAGAEEALETEEETTE
jgi:hypothetical protein